MSPIFIRKVNCPHYGWLSNMSPYRIVIGDIFWRTAEAYFQSLRFAPDDSIREKIRMEKSPMGAKRVAKQNASRMVVEPMSEQDVENMRLTLRLKFKCNQNPERFSVPLDSLKNEKAQLVNCLKEIKKHLDMVDK